MLQKLEQKVLARLKAGKLRSIDILHTKGVTATSSSSSSSDEVEGKKLPLVDFSSNDYLGLARSRSLFHIIEQASRDYTAKVAIDQPILGSTGSRLLTGNSQLHCELEQYLADFHRQRYALLANSGWDLNFGLLNSICMEETVVIYDELVHNSLLMGIRASKHQMAVKFRHNDVDALKLVLESCQGSSNIIVIVESIYSMDGDVCPIAEVLDAAYKHQALVLVDEAHSTGMLGSYGEGLVSGLQLNDHPSLLGCVHTFGKAVGQHGAAVLTNHAVLLQYLVNYCSPIIYSTSLPLFNILAIRESYECIRRCHLERDHLQRLIELFKEGARKYELPCLISSTSIQGVIIPTNEAVLRVSRELYQSNMHCFPIRAPTVATGSERLRIILHAHNTEDEVRYLCRRLADVHAS